MRIVITATVVLPNKATQTQYAYYSFHQTPASFRVRESACSSARLAINNYYNRQHACRILVALVSYNYNS